MKDGYSFSSGAILIATVLSGCIGPSWTTVESNFTDSIVDKKLTGPGLLSSDVKTSSRFFQKALAEDLEKAGYLQSNESLHGYLTSVGMTCLPKTSLRQSCRLARYNIERLSSGGSEDGAYRVDWNVTVAWNNTGAPIRPSITLDRTTKRADATP